MKCAQFTYKLENWYLKYRVFHCVLPYSLFAVIGLMDCKVYYHQFRRLEEICLQHGWSCPNGKFPVQQPWHHKHERNYEWLRMESTSQYPEVNLWATDHIGCISIAGHIEQQGHTVLPLLIFFTTSNGTANSNPKSKGLDWIKTGLLKAPMPQLPVKTHIDVHLFVKLIQNVHSSKKRYLDLLGDGPNFLSYDDML